MSRPGSLSVISDLGVSTQSDLTRRRKQRRAAEGGSDTRPSRPARGFTPTTANGISFSETEGVASRIKALCLLLNLIQELCPYMRWVKLLLGVLVLSSALASGQDLNPADVRIGLDEALPMALKAASKEFPDLHEYILYSVTPLEF